MSRYNSVVDLAKDAITIQDACNLSGVVHSFSEAMTALRELCPNEGTDFYNKHPIAVLFSSKIASLTDSEGLVNFSRAYEWCKQVEAGKPVSELPVNWK